MEALSAHRLVHFAAPDQLDLLLTTGPFGETGVHAAGDAHCREFGDALRNGQEVQNVAERLPLEGGVQGSHDHYLAVVGPVVGLLSNLKY